ncbi:MAG: DUF222 domain-containing protein [Ilumatobacteraceae bacterium]
MRTTASIERVVDGLRGLADVDLDVLSDVELDEALNGLQAARRLFDAQLCRLAHRWEQRGVWSSDGSKSSTARMARDGQIAKSNAQRALLRGRHLEAAPIVAAAFEAGELSVDQVDVLLAAQPNRERLFARDEPTLVDEARRLRVTELDRVLKYWRQRADAELNHDGPEPALPAPSLTLIPINGAVAIDGELDPVGRQIVATALDAIIADLALDGPRPEQRAAALVKMARRAMAMPADGRPARILANVAIGHDAFAHLCEPSSGTVIRPGHLVPYLDALDIRSILFDAATHAVATSKRRTFVGSLRAVIEVRDLHCQHPSGCDEPIDRCDVDHVLPWSYGGQTSQDNGRLLCRFHNRIEPQHTGPPATAIDEWIIHRIDATNLHTTDLINPFQAALN